MILFDSQHNVFGVVTGTATFTQFPSGTARLLRFKGNPDNIGTFELKIWGDTDEQTYPIDAGDDTDWVVAPFMQGNVRGVHNFGYRDISGSVDKLHYWIQK